MKEYKVRAFRCKSPPRWYENYLNIDFPYFMPETVEEESKVLGFLDQFPRYWIQSKDMPVEIMEAAEGVGRNYAIRYEDSEVRDPEGNVKRLYKNWMWINVDENGDWATDEVSQFQIDHIEKRMVELDEDRKKFLDNKD